MADETPPLRADALDDDPAEWEDDSLEAKDVVEPSPATHPVASPHLEPYENSEGGWSFRPYYR